MLLVFLLFTSLCRFELCFFFLFFFFTTAGMTGGGLEGTFGALMVISTVPVAADHKGLA